MMGDVSLILIDIRYGVEEVFTVATSSITKQFVVKDPKAFEKILQESAELPNREATQDSPSLKKGREALKQFSLR